MRHGITSPARTIAALAALPAPAIDPQGREFLMTFTRPSQKDETHRGFYADGMEASMDAIVRAGEGVVHIEVRPVIPMTFEEGHDAHRYGPLHAEASGEALRGWMAAYGEAQRGMSLRHLATQNLVPERALWGA